MCLSLGCGITADEHEPSRVIELDIDAKYDTVHNNDGISIFDVTEPGSPRYAMMQLTEHDGIDVDEDGEYVEIDTTSDAFRANTILNASDYMLRYKEELSGDSATVQVQMLDDLPLLDVAALASVWPHGNFRSRKQADSSGLAEKTAPVANPVGSLTAASMRAVIERTVQGDLSNLELLAEAEQVPGFTKALREHLHANPESVQGKPLRTLLGHVHRKCPLVDLSPFLHLSSEDVLEVIEIVANSGDAFSLVLPDLEGLAAADLRELLSSGLICELRLGERKLGDLRQFLDIIDGTSVTSFNVPELYARSFAPFDLGQVRNREEYDRFGSMYKPWESPVPSLPRPKQFPITQLVFVQWPAARTPPDCLRRRFDDFVMPWSEALTTETEGRMDSEAMLLSLPMSDYFLSAAQGIKRLPTFVSHLARPGLHGTGLEVGNAVQWMLRRLALKASPNVIFSRGDTSRTWVSSSHHNDWVNESNITTSKRLGQNTHVIVTDIFTARPNSRSHARRAHSLRQTPSSQHTRAIRSHIALSTGRVHHRDLLRAQLDRGSCTSAEAALRIRDSRRRR